MSNVQLSVSNFNAKRGHLVQVARQRVLAWCAAHDKMSLISNTIDLDATSFQRANKLTSCRRLGSVVFKIIVVVIQLDIWIIFGGGRKGDRNEFGANLQM